MSQAGAKDTPEQAEFRQHCKNWLKDNLPPEPPVRLPQSALEIMTREQLDYLCKWQKAAYATSDAADYGSSRSVQYRGGIGFTWECFVHIFFKRQKHNQALYGNGIYQRARLAETLIN